MGKQFSRRYRERARELAARTPDPNTVLSELADELRRRPPIDWNEAAILLLRAEAVVEDLSRQAAGPTDSASIARRLPELLRQLRFDANVIRDGAHLLQSPAGFDVETFRKEVSALLFLPSDGAP